VAGVRSLSGKEGVSLVAPLMGELLELNRGACLSCFLSLGTRSPTTVSNSQRRKATVARRPLSAKSSHCVDTE
jgi:hypothetical protein